jgi:predicted Zn-dependent protease
LVAVAFVGVYVAAEQLNTEWETANSIEKISTSKIEFWPPMASAVARYPLAGMGRGAFESAFTRFGLELNGCLFTHAENWPLQLAAEFGLIPATLLILAGAVALFRAIRRLELDVVESTALAALVGVLLHDLFDFALEFPPTALGLVLVLGILARARDPGSAQGRTSTLRLPLVPAAIGGAALAGLSVLAIFVGRHTLSADENALAEVIGSGATPDVSLKAALPLIERHPADYLLPGTLASVYGASKSTPPAEALALANRTFFLRPLDPDAHRTAARALLRMGKRSQAMLEYRLAWKSGGSDYAQEALARARSLDELQRVVPPEAKFVSEAASRLWSSQRRDEALGLLEWGREEYSTDPDAPGLWSLSAGYLMDSKRLPEALEAIDHALAVSPSKPEFMLTRAWVLASLQRRADAIAQLEDALRKNVGHFEVSIALAEQLHAEGERARSQDVLKRLGPFVTSSAERARLFAVEASFSQADGRLARALEGYLSASRIQPENCWYRYSVAQIYEQLQRPDDALREVREGVRLEGRERPDVKDWIARLVEKRKELDELRRQKAILGNPEEASAESN